MPTPRFHLETALAPGALIELPPDAAHHASRVLRLRQGDQLAVFDGTGGEYFARIVSLARDGVTIEVGAFDPVEREAPLAVTLVQGISSGDRMDLTIQKAVELGVAGIQPILAARSLVRLKGERGDSRREHWQRVAISACEQCGRNRIPSIAEAVPVSGYRPAEESLKFLLTPGATRKLRSLAIVTGSPLVIAAGPEAGFSPHEETAFIAAGFMPVQLGPRILRTETAGPAALSALNSLFGDA